jgi:hypothetical protein
MKYLSLKSESYRGEGVLYTLKIWKWKIRWVSWYEYWSPDDPKLW